MAHAMSGVGGSVTLNGRSVPVSGWSAKWIPDPKDDEKNAAITYKEVTFEVPWHPIDIDPVRTLAIYFALLRHRPYVYLPRSLVNWLFPERN